MKLYAARVAINSQGYDGDGHYWGIGQKLFWVHTLDLTVNEYLRAKDACTAKAQVRRSHYHLWAKS